MPTDVMEQVSKHLLRSDRQEDLCFALWYPSTGPTRVTALIHKVLLPLPGERRVHGNTDFAPEYFERAIGEAVSLRCGLAFLHSHPTPGWQGMSRDDVIAEDGHAAATKGATGLPLVGLTLGTDGAWSARFWMKTGRRSYQREWCESVRVVGQRISVTYMDELVPPPSPRPELTRTISAWGHRTQAHLARLRIGVIGAGSVGSIVAEALARIGVRRIGLMDFDSVEIVNLDRLLHATRRDALLKRAKVDVIARGVRQGATSAGFLVDTWETSITEHDGFKAALDCDVLFCCVDRPWPRSALNLIAYAHLIPVIDGGIAVETSKAGAALKRADWRAHVAAPGRKCLECLGQFDPGLVSTDRDGYFDDPAYIAGLPKDHPLRRNENVFAFSLSTASFELLQLLSMVVAPLGLCNPGAQMYHFVTSSLDIDRGGCSPNCIYCRLVAHGDRCGIQVTARHAQAEEARQQRERIRKTWQYRLVTVAERIAAVIDHWVEPSSSL